MKKLLLIFLLAALPANAGPLEWAKHHKRFLLMETIAVAGASIDAHGLHHCRRVNGVEPCTAHYGSAWAVFGISTGMTTIVFPSIAEGCWKNQGGRFCNILAYTPPVVQASWGIHEWTITHHEKSFDSPVLHHVKE